ncbi:MAG: 3-dehydroquinate synthase [Deltaproteobacteria bacterium]|nr:3-dehydroquinate synthase [Deltaproteobacteria bacterium]
MTPLLHLKLSGNPYSIYFVEGRSKELEKLFSSFFKARKWVMVSNPKVYRLHGKQLEKKLSSLGEVHTVFMPDGEKYKTLETLQKLYKAFLKHKVDRNTPVVALGGGVVGDVAGFAAATFLRGLPLIQIPTTLLAQVDSSVGGKTAVDLPEGKNLVGAFYQPHLVYIDTSYLNTLPQREILCGSAEVIKYGVIKSPSLFKLLEEQIHSFLKLDPGLLARIVRECVEIKAKVVQGDEKETKGLRIILNFGHTLGHAAETLMGYKKMSHGEGVAVGMAFAAQLSQRMGFCSLQSEQRLKNLIIKAGFSIQIPFFKASQYLQVMARDKKMQQGQIQYVLMKKIGQVFSQKLALDFVEKELRHCLKNS